MQVCLLALDFGEAAVRVKPDLHLVFEKGVQIRKVQGPGVETNKLRVDAGGRVVKYMRRVMKCESDEKMDLDLRAFNTLAARTVRGASFCNPTTTAGALSRLRHRPTPNSCPTAHPI